MKLKTMVPALALVLLVSCGGNQTYVPKIASLSEQLAAKSDPVYSSPEEMASAAMKGIDELTPEALKAKLNSGNKFHLIDIRTNEEFAAGHIEGAIHIPRGVLEFRLKRAIPKLSKDDEIVIYCKTGELRSPLAYHSLKQLGFKNVYSLKGGWLAWPDKGDAVVDGEYSLEKLPEENYGTPQVQAPKAATPPPAGAPKKVKKRIGGGGC